jgi:hypothetical protein
MKDCEWGFNCRPTAQFYKTFLDSAKIKNYVNLSRSAPEPKYIYRMTGGTYEIQQNKL